MFMTRRATEWSQARTVSDLGARWLLSRRETANSQRGLHRQAINALADAIQITLVDPRWGPSDRLWAAMHEAVR